MLRFLLHKRELGAAHPRTDSADVRTRRGCRPGTPDDDIARCTSPVYETVHHAAMVDVGAPGEIVLDVLGAVEHVRRGRREGGEASEAVDAWTKARNHACACGSAGAQKPIAVPMSGSAERST